MPARLSAMVSYAATTAKVRILVIFPPSNSGRAGVGHPWRISRFATFSSYLRETRNAVRPRTSFYSAAAGKTMGRWLTWVSHQRLTGWACSECGWTFPVPSLLTNQEAKSAYDRLASAQFQVHDCAAHGQPARVADSESFTARARKLVSRGFKPKDAAEITLQEIIFENRSNPAAAKKARDDAEDFLRHVKDGLI